MIATASAQDLDKVLGLGADKVIDFRAQRFEEELKNIDVVIDTVGGGVQRRSFTVLKPGGRLISAVSKPNAQEAERRSVYAGFMLVDVTTPALAKIASWSMRARSRLRLATSCRFINSASRMR